MVVSIVYVLLAFVAPAILKWFGFNIPYINTDANGNGIPDAMETKPTPAGVVKAATADVEAIAAAVIAKLQSKVEPASTVSVTHNADGSALVTAPGVNVTTAAPTAK